MYTREYYSASRKNETMSFAATWMDLRDYHIKWRKSERGRHTIWYHLYVEFKYDTNELTYKTDSQTQKTELWLMVGGEEGMDWEPGISRSNYYIEDG